MAQIEIPEPWRKQVCAILATEKTGGLIRWTGDAEARYEVGAAAVKVRSGDNNPVWKNEIYQPISPLPEKSCARCAGFFRAYRFQPMFMQVCPEI
jgi:hypothetical protein